MLAHPKRFLMMHNNFVQKKTTKQTRKNISVIRSHDVVIGSHVCYPLSHRNVNIEGGRIKLYINQIYVFAIIHREFTLQKS